MPIADYELSALHLDNKRLGKQRVECLQLLNVNLPLRFPQFEYKSKGWVNHPAAKMWRGHESQLISYTKFICGEWIRRGYKDTILPRMNALESELQISDPIPSWIGDDKLHASHRSNLLRKFPEWYNQFGWSESSDLPYIWPVQ